jgi:hypothetical protein
MVSIFKKERSGENTFPAHMETIFSAKKVVAIDRSAEG